MNKEIRIRLARLSDSTWGMTTDSLHQDVQNFREALDACHSDLDPTVFGHFPSGCCGTVSELLAAFLEEQGHGSWPYVCGTRLMEDGQNATHAWLERDGCIIDITRDQFDKRQPGLVTADRSWHDERFPDQEQQEDFGELRSELCDAYARIKKEIGRGSNAA
ncbi:hypothetical protein [Leisingera daeponensis]|uniref:hypothetical protein n=1 Tax=Leisingera daeponensis TaxID=405746 RepID=UPI0006888211|nr:hypothetical protein [Leisingera daeponensis]